MLLQDNNSCYFCIVKSCKNMIDREIIRRIQPLIGGKKAIILLGARQVGKSTLLHTLFDDKKDALWLNGDDVAVQHSFENMTTELMRTMLAGYRWLIVDEAQRISNIGLRLKLVTDHIPEVQVVATGSSSFQLAEGIYESLAGRKREFLIYPLSFGEMVKDTNLIAESGMIPNRMIYGYYPEVVTSKGEEKDILSDLTSSYLYKDILALDNLRSANKITRLLQALAYQIGQQVSYNELGQMVGMDSKTVEKYIDILEKCFVVFRLGSFSRNLRNELKTTRKIYFWDLGIRNAVISNFQPIENRSDAGEMWENFVIAERLKHLDNNHILANNWFWRTRHQQEIDYLEESDGQLIATEIKWNPKKSNVKAPEIFLKTYPDAQFQVITPENIASFLL